MSDPIKSNDEGSRGEGGRQQLAEGNAASGACRGGGLTASGGGQRTVGKVTHQELEHSDPGRMGEGKALGCAAL